MAGTIKEGRMPKTWVPYSQDESVRHTTHHLLQRQYHHLSWDSSYSVKISLKKLFATCKPEYTACLESKDETENFHKQTIRGSGNQQETTIYRWDDAHHSYIYNMFPRLKLVLWTATHLVFLKIHAQKRATIISTFSMKK